MRRSIIAALTTLLPLIFNGVSEGSRAGLEPSHVAEIAPVIITGTIVRIELGPEADRSLDTAYIKVAKIHRSALTDVQVKVGDEFPVMMIGKKRRVGSSEDFRYAKGTEAIWLV